MSRLEKTVNESVMFCIIKDGNILCELREYNGRISHASPAAKWKSWNIKGSDYL